MLASAVKKAAPDCIGLAAWLRSLASVLEVQVQARVLSQGWRAVAAGAAPQNQGGGGGGGGGAALGEVELVAGDVERAIYPLAKRFAEANRSEERLEARKARQASDPFRRGAPGGSARSPKTARKGARAGKASFSPAPPTPPKPSPRRPKFTMGVWSA